MSQVQDLDREKLRECFDASTESMKYLIQNYEDLAKRHDKKWIAVLDSQVVEVADSIEELSNAIKKHQRSKCIVTEYVTTEPVAMFF